MPQRPPTRPAARWALAAALLGVGLLPLVAAPAEAAPALGWTLRGGGALPALTDPAVAYDPDTASVVLFGGLQAGSGLSSATWVYSGGSWTQAATGPAGAGGPPAREGASMAFDAAHHQFLLFGGLGAGGQALDDTWAWNGASWVQLSPVGAPPPVRFGAGMAEDAAGHLVLFGGTTTGAAAAGPTTTAPSAPAAGGSSGTPASPGAAPTTSALSDTWTWDGTGWSLVASPAGASPSARTAAAMAWDPVHDQTVLFGGSPTTDGTGAPLADTWTWNGAAWAQVAPATNPPARAGATLVAEPGAEGVALVGGSSDAAPTSGAAGDAWSWDGAGWSPLATTGPVPPGRRLAGGAYDTATSTAVIVGGVDAGGAPVQATALLAALAAPAPPPTTTPPTTVRAPAGPTPVTVATPTSVAPTPRPGPTTTVAPAHPPATTQGAAPLATGPTPEPARSAAPTVAVLHPGQHLDLLGAGFAPGTLVTITWHSTPRRIGVVRASPTGTVAYVVVVPADARSGMHHFVLTGAGADGGWATLATAVRVVAPPGPPSDGVQTAALVGLALLLPLATWSVLTWRSRRRRPVAA